MLDITTTATLRSEILDQTLSSFKEKLFKEHPCRLILNIDPVGDDTIENVLETARKYFGTALKYRIAAKPNFSKAFIWCFSQVETPYVFHLEDDWELLRDVDLLDMIRLLEERPDFATMRLPYRISTHDSKNWSTFFEFDGEVFVCPEDLKIRDGFSGHPSLIRTSFIKKCLPYMRPDHNPEKEFHHGSNIKILREVAKYKYGVYQKQYEKEYIKDIGRHWLIKTRWRKSGIKAFFNHWERIEDDGK